MKSISLTILALLAFTYFSTSAQTWDEWFKQKKTQKKYHYEQLVALKARLETIKKGIAIVHGGLTTFYNIKNGDFSLHSIFFNSQTNPNPQIANTAKVADIILFQIFIIKKMKETYRFCKTNKNFTAEEIRYVAAVYSNMLFLTDASLTELNTIIKSDKAQMKDDERISRIDKLFEDVQEKKTFVNEWDDEVRILALQREREKRETEILKKLNDING